MDLALVADGGLGWLDASGPESHLVLSTRVRLARNLEGRPFPLRSVDSDRIRVLSAVQEATTGAVALTGAQCLKIDQLSQPDRQLLHERHLVSKELAVPQSPTPPRPGSALIIGTEAGVMVNEEDHVRLQGLVSGFALRSAWSRVARLDAELGQRLAFAFHPEFGYLTSCPTNVGTGLRASILIHLPGLVLTKEINKVLQSLGQVGLTFRGLYGEGSEVVGNLFQVSNQTTLGKSEVELLDHLAGIVRQVIGYEERAREVLLRDAPGVIEDKVWRAFGLLRYARTLSFDEGMNLLSAVRLGVGLGLIPDVGMYGLNRMLMFSQPAHLAQGAGPEQEAGDPAVRRATLVRQTLVDEAGRRG
ncbi:MAG: protein arginine kinase [Gemmatimonadota bacterium]